MIIFFKRIFLVALLALVCGRGYATDVQQFNSNNRQVSLLELYSSQGCSSCPPAERWVSALKDDPRLWRDIIPVVFHVDYWDALGWADPYASAANSHRQRSHNKQGNINAVYTPGFVLNGAEWRQWFSRPTLDKLPTKPVGELSGSLTNGVLNVSYSGDTPQPLSLNIAVLGFDVLTNIKRGENRGLAISQDFVVLKHQQIDSDNRRWHLPVPASAYSGKKALVLWVAEPDSLVPLQAAGGWL